MKNIFIVLILTIFLSCLNKSDEGKTLHNYLNIDNYCTTLNDTCYYNIDTMFNLKHKFIYNKDTLFFEKSTMFTQEFDKYLKSYENNLSNKSVNDRYVKNLFFTDKGGVLIIIHKNYDTNLADTEDKFNLLKNSISSLFIYSTTPIKSKKEDILYFYNHLE